MKNTANTVKLLIFTLVMVLIFAGLAIVFSQVRFASTESYNATFTSASGLGVGDKVRIAGVPVGSVKGVKVGKDDLAHVEFDVDKKYPIFKSTKATVRYENLVGDRYMELMEGTGSMEQLADGGSIPKEQTSPALDLDLLLGGFKPLLRALDPNQVNQLTSALLQVFQGQGDQLVSLLNGAGSFTKTLADRDELIGSVINNLNTVIKTIDDRGDQFSTTIDQLQQLVSGLAQDRDPIGAAIPRIAGATGDLAKLLQEARPDLRETIAQTGRTANQLDLGKDTLDSVLQQLPATYRKLVRVGSYGSFFQFYVCSTRMKLTGPDGKDIMIVLPGGQETGRCAR
ncbi:MCE family protein [Antrihabitans cavernicola]|uniref:MCE family protein n=1 Tax=Antrihabitans cavernicola TaxID=2495913 RepID=A0A5A7S707_9NOCA|nr:MCE family protein [Spelaeibacter cavernicola]KAA0021938.1 MCE family protein [Spelaeibacter cavernicola]